MISAGVYLLGCLVYWIWASGEVQPWAQINTTVESKQKPADDVTYVGYINESLEME